MTHHSPAAAVPCTQTRTGPYERTRRIGLTADQLDYVIGVDTHLEEHVLAVVAAPSGALARKIEGRTFYRCTIEYAGDEPTAEVCAAYDPTDPGRARFRENC